MPGTASSSICDSLLDRTKLRLSESSVRSFPSQPLSLVSLLYCKQYSKPHNVYPRLSASVNWTEKSCPDLNGS